MGLLVMDVGMVAPHSSRPSLLVVEEDDDDGSFGLAVCSPDVDGRGSHARVNTSCAPCLRRLHRMGEEAAPMAAYGETLQRYAHHTTYMSPHTQPH